MLHPVYTDGTNRLHLRTTAMRPNNYEIKQKIAALIVNVQAT